MGEYARLNRMLESYEEDLVLARQQCRDTDDEAEINELVERIGDIQQSIGEIKGALLEMASVDGLDDCGEVFDY